MKTHDPAASIEAEPVTCKWCGIRFTCDPMHRRASYCSDDCRRAAAALRVKLTRKTLTDAGLCPCCKKPRQ